MVFAKIEYVKKVLTRLCIAQQHPQKEALSCAFWGVTFGAFPTPGRAYVPEGILPDIFPSLPARKLCGYRHLSLLLR